ncbi:NAD(P)-dependent oxidoreductase [Bacillus sp. B15-48]|uniref:SAF domain-containing protein n=1 Tax=Bacillus sp. B15-48 TaxID=1548601 RepID=UPI00193F7473|nr:NAD(P)-dependent oxidoreductase [Bacillus sp. B15-48]MBM4764470.1 NAD(P)-dependent oxidoreductase [Bacillus sp. B15-48]
MQPKTKIGVIGTGFISKGLIKAIKNEDDLVVSKVLTRRKISDIKSFPDKELITNSVNELIENSEIIVECSGDTIYGTEIINSAFLANLPVITMNSELQVTTGSYFAGRGMITEAEGDQPGCIAALKENVVQMGFKPLVYGNIKGFLNRTPKKEEMEYWSKRNNLSLQMVTSFTDGTKVQFEQALVANGLGGDIVQTGLLGPASDDVESGGKYLAEQAKKHGSVISDYLLCPKGPAGVFITAEHEENQRGALNYFKMGEGPYYTLTQNFHLCHLEIMKTIRRVLTGGGVLLNNSSTPSISVGAVAKTKIAPGTKISHGIGSFLVRGEALKIIEHPKHIPIGLLVNAVITNHIEEGQLITMDDVVIPDSLALKAWKEIKNKAINDYEAIV